MFTAIFFGGLLLVVFAVLVWLVYTLYDCALREYVVVQFSDKLRVVKRTSYNGTVYIVQGCVFGIWSKYSDSHSQARAEVIMSELAKAVKNRNTPDEVLKEQEL